MIDLTPESVVEFAERTAARVSEDYVYSNPTPREGVKCAYVHTADPLDMARAGLTADGYDASDFAKVLEDAKPGCIAGTYLYEMGVPLVEMYIREDENAYVIMQELADAGVISLPSRAVRQALRAMQMEQDTGGTWHDALSIGITELRLIQSRDQ